MERLKELYREHVGREVAQIEELPSSGSNRRYFRMTGDDGLTLVGVKGTSSEENRAFVEMSRHFLAKGLNVPEVYAVSEDWSCYIQEDLGSTMLFDAVAVGRSCGNYSEEEKALLKKAIAMLPEIQFKGAEGLDFNVCYPQPEFDRRMVAFDLNYFKYCFLKSTGLEFLEVKLEDDFERMADVLMEMKGDEFMYRDFQARNVMLKDGEPYFIDFQGGRKGPIYYDVASFVWQAKANYGEELRAELVKSYIESLRKFVDVDEAEFWKRLRHFVLFRTLQVLGAYGFRGYFEKKPHFLESIPFAIDNLRRLIEEPFEEYPYLNQVLTQLTEMHQFKNMAKKEKLQVKVFSFAYKKGIPNDTSGNGGGFVFDCRAINNPGKYEHYKHFTGKDQEVIKFLEDDGGVFPFLESAERMVDSHVERFMERGFKNMMVCFGCTGGQHRSVYCAERMGEHLRGKYDIIVKVIHREQE